MLLNVQVQKDSATHISKEVTREEAEALSTRFPVKVATADGLLDWTEFVEKHPEASGDEPHAPDEKAVLASLLKRKDMSKTAFKKLSTDEQDKLMVEETAAMASEAEIAAGKAGPVTGANGSDVTSPD